MGFVMHELRQAGKVTQDGHVKKQKLVIPRGAGFARNVRVYIAPDEAATSFGEFIDGLNLVRKGDHSFVVQRPSKKGDVGLGK